MCKQTVITSKQTQPPDGGPELESVSNKINQVGLEHDQSMK